MDRRKQVMALPRQIGGPAAGGYDMPARAIALTKWRLMTAALLSFACIMPSFAQYSDDLTDVYSYKYFQGMGAMPSPKPIGSLGDIQAIVDLRGFVPMSLWHNRIIGPTFHWVKIPTRKALLILYYGDLHITDVASDTTKLEGHFDHTRFMEESDARGEMAEWCKLAYSLATSQGEHFFSEVAGGGFESVQPISIFLTRQSAFIMLSFGYSSPLVLGNYGQVLVVLELSRTSRNYKAIYPVYSTTLFSKSTHDMLVATAPYVARAALKIGMAYLGVDSPD